jgi:alpha-tubulin suppressor-like RCC1 family protein
VAALLGSPLHQVAAGGAHTCALSEHGEVFTWGLNDKGQLGHDKEDVEVGLPQEVPLPEPATAVAAGYNHTLCLGESGSVWSFGCNGRGQLGVGRDIVLQREPRMVQGMQGEDSLLLAAGSRCLHATESCIVCPTLLTDAVIAAQAAQFANY